MRPKKNPQDHYNQAWQTRWTEKKSEELTQLADVLVENHKIPTKSRFYITRYALELLHKNLKRTTQSA